MANIIRWRRKPVLLVIVAATLLVVGFLKVLRTYNSTESIIDRRTDSTYSKVLIGEENSKKTTGELRFWPELNGPFNPSDPGEGGLALATKPEEEMLKNKAYAEYGFNQFISDKISLHRSLPDPRHFL